MRRLSFYLAAVACILSLRAIWGGMLSTLVVPLCFLAIVAYVALIGASKLGLKHTFKILKSPSIDANGSRALAASCRTGGIVVAILAYMSRDRAPNIVEGDAFVVFISLSLVPAIYGLLMADWFET